MSAQDNAALARRVYESFNNGDFDRALALAAEDIEIVLTPFGQTFNGHDGFDQFMRGFKAAFPDGKVNLTNQVATDDQVTNEFTFTGTHTGPLMTPTGEVAPTGRKIDYPVCEVWRFKNGKVAGFRNYFDSATMMRQLGLI